MVEQATSKQVLLPKNYKHKMNPLYSSNYDQMLPSDYPFKSSQQIERNIVLDQITDSLTDSDNILNESLQSCFGLILCEHEQDGNTTYVYGTGILIHNNIQNVSCRRLNKLYTNIRFVTGLNNNRYCESYDIKYIHYPQQYAISDMDCCYYDFAILQLNDDLNDRCGYVGCKIGYDVNNRSITSYRYFHIETNTLKQRVLSNTDEEIYQRLHVVGIHSGTKMIAINQDIKNLINKWNGQQLQKSIYRGTQLIFISSKVMSDYLQALIYVAITSVPQDVNIQARPVGIFNFHKFITGKPIPI